MVAHPAVLSHPSASLVQASASAEATSATVVAVSVQLLITEPCLGVPVGCSSTSWLMLGSPTPCALHLCCRLPRQPQLPKRQLQRRRQLPMQQPQSVQILVLLISIDLAN